jgi:hypothetical protein
MWLLAFMVACSGGQLVEDTEVIEDTEEPVVEPPTVEGVLDTLPACEPGADDGTLALGPGCAGDVCVGMYAADVEAVLGAGNCDGSYPGYVSCWWESGYSISYRDLDFDGELDPDARNEGMYVYYPFAGGTVEGLASGVSMSCFVDVLGLPDSVEFSAGPDGFRPSSLFWYGWGFGVFDQYTINDYGQDGFSDYLYIAGDPDWEP